MRAWFRRVLPPETYVVLAVMLYLLAALAPVTTFRFFGGIDEFPLFTPMGLGALVLCTAAYAVYRVVGFHPLWSTPYREWLTQTPWQWGMPLPVGPVSLVPQDAVCVGIATGLSLLHPESPLLLIPVVFLSAHLVGLALSLLATGQKRHAYVIAFGLGGVVLLRESLIPAVMLLGLLSVVGWHGLRESLMRFRTWSDFELLQLLGLTTNSSRRQEIPADSKLGWPYDHLGPRRPSSQMSLSDTLATAVMSGWWYFVAATLVEDRDRGEIVLFTAAFCGILALFRLGRYISGHAPPISLRGRLLTMRWIIPRYDIVFLAPILLFAFAAAAACVTVAFQLPWRPAAAVTTGVLVFIASACPPRLSHWQLTGNHRIVPGKSQHASEFQQTQ